jgi:F-box-like
MILIGTGIFDRVLIPSLNTIAAMSLAGSVDAVPNEILTRIFANLHLENHIRKQQDLFVCALVCRRWYDIALPVLCQSFHFDAAWVDYLQRLHDSSNGTMVSLGYRSGPPKLLWGYIVWATEFRNGLSVKPSRLDQLLHYFHAYKAKIKNGEHVVNRPLRFDMCRYISIWLDNPKSIDVALLMVKLIVSVFHNLQKVDACINLGLRWK